MAKPIVPAGPIAFEADPPKVSLVGIRRRLEALASDPLLGRIDKAIRDEEWAAATDLLYRLLDHTGAANTAVLGLVSRIRSKRHSPLFPELEQHADEVASHDH